MANVPERHQHAGDYVDVQRCAFGDDDRGYCGERAVEHIYVSKLSGFGTMACEKHKGWFDTHHAHDRHPVVGPCGLPGTIWVYSDADSPGWCEFEGFDGLETAIAEAEITEPAPAMTM